MNERAVVVFNRELTELELEKLKEAGWVTVMSPAPSPMPPGQRCGGCEKSGDCVIRASIMLAKRDDDSFDVDRDFGCTLWERKE